MATTFMADRDRVVGDLAEHGYAVIEGALTPTEVAALKDGVVAVAAREVADGTDYVYEDGANQRVWSLLNKGDCFVSLAQHPLAMAFMDELLGPGFLLSNLDANIAGPGGNPMFLHADQSYAPRPWPYPLVANIMWMLDDFTPDNGATRVVPGSHLRDDTPSPAETVPVCGPAGTAMVFEGRLWHQTGANVTASERRHGILAYYCRPFMRQQENFFLSIDPAVLERATPRLRQLLGYEIYLSLGMVDGMPRTGPRF